MNKNEQSGNDVENNFFASAPCGVAVLRFADTIECQYFNDGFAALSDRTREELAAIVNTSGELEKIIYPMDKVSVLSEIDKCKLTASPINTTFRFLTKGGELKWLHMSANKLREDCGFPVYYCVFAEPSKQAMLYRNIADGACVGIMVSDVETYEIYYLNRIGRQLMQVSDEQPYGGRKCYEFLFNKDCPCEECVLKNKTMGATGEVIRHFPELGVAVKVRSAVINWLGRTALVEYVADVTTEYQKRFEQEVLLNRVPAGIGIYEISNGSLNQVYMNDSYYRLVKDKRETRDKLQKEGFLSLIHPEDAHIITEAARSVYHGQDKFSLFHRVLCGDGSYRWFRLDGAVISRETDKITAYCVYTDYDEIERSRVRLEKAHVTLENKYAQELAQRKALEKDSAVIVKFNITQDKLISCFAQDDRFYSHASGLSSAEVMSDLIKRVPGEEDRLKSISFFDPQKAKKSLAKGVLMNSEEYRCRQKDGMLHWIKAISSVETDPETNDLISYTYLKDIDKERKRSIATNSVIDEETDYVLLVSTIADVCTIVWVREHYMKDNKVIQPSNDLPFSSSAEYVRLDTVLSEDKAAVELLMDKSAIMRALEKSNVITITYRRMGLDGRIHRKKVRAFYLDDMKEDVVIAQRDITDLYEEEQEQRRKLEAASRAKSDFLSRISHDMRTPLNGILGTVYLAREKNDPVELKKDIDAIESSGRLLLNLVNDTLDMSRIESGRIELHPEVCDEKKMFDAIFATIQPSLEKKDIHLNKTIIGVDWKQMELDVPRLQQVFLNIFSNAIKFTPMGGTIDWVMECLEEKSDYVIDRFIIRDNGCGMSEEFQKHMFEPFAQENRVNTDQTMGTGLGLSIVKNIIELMGGKISVNSKVGKGTEFCITLRLSVRCSLKELPKQPKKKVVSFHGSRILLCEDNRLNTMIAEKLLEKVGCVVDAVTNGKLGLDKFKASKAGYYSAILMDIRMPEMDGLEATKAIRALNREDAKTIPVIAMSANAFAEDIKGSLAVGMNAHLAKPIDPQTLYETLASKMAVEDKQ